MINLTMIHPDYSADPKDAGHVVGFGYKSSDFKKVEKEFWGKHPGLNGESPLEKYLGEVLRYEAMLRRVGNLPGMLIDIF
jgi:hypothetical protein